MNTLQTAVINQLGYESLDEECVSTLQDVSEHGADGGYGQFVYYHDTIKFFDDNRTDILKSVTDMAESLGEEPSSMVKSFRCLNGDFNHEVDQVLMGIDCDDDVSVKNALAWFALEETAHELTDRNHA